MRQRDQRLCGAGVVGVVWFLSGAAAPSHAIASPSDLLLEGPSLEAWEPELGPGSPRATAPGPGPIEDEQVLLEITAFEVALRVAPGSDRPAGTARLGARLVGEPVTGGGCAGGAWYRVNGGAYLCTADGAVVVGEGGSGEDRAAAPEASAAPESGTVPESLAAPEWSPALEQPNPLLYARVIRDGAPRLTTLPDAAEAEAIDAGAGIRELGDLVSRHMRGDYFLALARQLTHEGRAYYKTVHGRFVRAEDVELKPVPPMRGERLGKDAQWPLAFALDDTPVYCEAEGALAPCGTMQKHARFPVAGALEHEGVRHLRGPGGVLVPATALRVAEPIARPADIPAGAKWIHVHLASQTLTAYEGDTPVYVTLVSSGRDGYHTPAGLYRVQRKYLTKTMRGKDDVSGRYEVQEVPWTLYYDHNYAIHGAYWHNRFGRTKSHGCINVPPVDARWLYYWSTLALPAGWHSLARGSGTYVYISGQTPPDGQ